MSRLSEAYWRAVRRVEQRDAINAQLKRQRQTRKAIAAKRAVKYREIDKQMAELRRPPDTPPWEKE